VHVGDRPPENGENRSAVIGIRRFVAPHESAQLAAVHKHCAVALLRCRKGLHGSAATRKPITGIEIDML
jgi:hypothetical protein